jgi:hypothetical protein
MSAPEGNEFWKLADWGKPKAFTPEELWEKACEYFTWCNENPWNKNEAIKSGDYAGTIIKIPTERPYTLQALCIFSGIVTQTFYNYAQTEAYLDITTRIREIIYSQKFEGAAVGAFNASIIARDLGLTDKTDSNIQHSGEFIFKGMNVIKPNGPDPGVCS